MGVNDKDGVMSPEQLRLEDQIKLLEAELLNSGKEDDVMSEDSSIEDDVQVTKNVMVTMNAEEEQMRSFVEQHQSLKQKPIEKEVATTHKESGRCATTEEKKTDFRRLTSMFEQKLGSTLPTPPPINLSTPSSASGTSTSFEKIKASITTKHDLGIIKKDGSSLSIKEGKAIFERAFPAASESDIRPKAQAKSEQTKAATSGNKEENAAFPVQEGSDILAKKPRSNASRGNEPSLKDRISMFENSTPPKPPLPPERKACLVAEDETPGARNSSPREPHPPILHPPNPRQFDAMELCQGNVHLSGNPPVLPKEKAVISPSMPFTPTRPEEAVAFSVSTEKRAASSMYNDGDICQRRAALMRGLKRHLYENSKDSSVEVLAGPRGINSYTDIAVSSSPIEHDESEICEPYHHSPLQNKCDVTAVNTSQIECGHGQEGGLLGEGISRPSSLQHSLSVTNTCATDNPAQIMHDRAYKNSEVHQCLGHCGEMRAAKKRGEDEASGQFNETTARTSVGLRSDENKVQSSLSISNSFGSDATAKQRGVSERMKICVGQLYGKVKTSTARVMTFFKPYCAVLWKYVVAFVVYGWTILSLLLGVVMKRFFDVTFSALLYGRECWDEHRLLMSFVPNALKKVASWAANIERGDGLIYTFLVVTIFADIYPTVPRSNVYIAMLLLFFRMVDWQDESQNHSIFLVAAVMVSICIDVDWLSWKYFPMSLEEDELAYRIEQDSGLLWTIAWYSILASVFLKIVCLNESLMASKQGNDIRQMLWHRFAGKCLISSRVPEDLGAAVKDKVIALSWIEMLCSLFCFGYFFAIEFDAVKSSSLLRDVSMSQIMLSLEGALLIKGATGFLVFLSLVRFINVKDFVGLVACHMICPTLVGSHSKGMDRGRILTKMKKSFKCIILTKTLDTVVGVFVWMGLVSVHSKTGFDAPKDITSLLGLVFATQVFTSVIAPILGTVVFWYIQISKQNHGVVRQQAMVDNTPISSTKMKHRNRNSVPSTKKNSIKNLDSKFSLSNPSCHRTDFVDKEFAEFAFTDDSDYNLSHPSNSQNLFETRITGAAIESSNLDLDVICSPRQFQAEWQSFQNGLTLKHRIHHVPILSDCHKYFHARRFYVVGSGVVGDESKLFVIAQRRVKTSSSQRKELSRCLVEITFNATCYEMNAEVRCHNQNEIRYFLSVLKLKDFFSIQ